MKLPEWETAYQKAVKTEATCNAIGAISTFLIILGVFIYVMWYLIPQAKEVGIF